MNILYSRINDTVLPAGEASLPISDMAIQRGYGIFDFFKIVNHKPVFLDDHLLGKNATGYSFITGEGVHTPMHPHHRPSAADNIEMPVPGLLVGGPNASASRQDKCEYLYMEPERQYTDKLCSYASNEIAINWNAPLVYLSGAVCALR